MEVKNSQWWETDTSSFPEQDDESISRKFSGEFRGDFQREPISNENKKAQLTTIDITSDGEKSLDNNAKEPED